MKRAVFLCDGNFTSRGESKGLSYGFNWFLSLSGGGGLNLQQSQSSIEGSTSVIFSASGRGSVDWIKVCPGAYKTCMFPLVSYLACIFKGCVSHFTCLLSVCLGRR